MLSNLYIKNFALVKELSIDFFNGLTVISGETGAGKTLVIEALSLVVGGRLNQGSVVNTGQIVATFELNKSDNAVSNWLDEKGLLDGNQCLLRRSFNTSGNKCYVNNTPVTQSQAGELGRLLLDLHGQRQYHRMLMQQEQARLYDSFCHASDLSYKVKATYKTYQNIQKKISSIKQSQTRENEEREYLRFQLKELEQLAPVNGEYQELDAKQKQASQNHSLISSAQKAMQVLDGYNEQKGINEGVLKQIHQLAYEMNGLSVKACQDISKIFEQSAMHLEDASIQLQDLVSSQQLNQQDVDALEQRLSQWHDLARKHRINPENLSSLFQQFKDRLHGLDSQASQLGELEKQLQETTIQLNSLCNDLTSKRNKGPQDFANKINNIIKELAMPEARLSVRLENEMKLGSQGAEKVHFMVRTNRGSKEDFIENIVSGGELSRISLAIYQAINDQNSNGTCIFFDEIDVGISGSVASKVGELLRGLSKNSQVICITHQPQVVARAHNHLLAGKYSIDETTYSKLEPLDETSSIKEIARMIGDHGTMEASLDLAKQIYQLGKQNEPS